ncbi:MAG TPA: transaldolase [Micromonosporaceae bacterium]|jgi:transaldolase
MSDRLAELSGAGVAIWLDDISRHRLASGSLEAMRRDQHVVGVTSNPTIFAKALAETGAYADQIADIALRGLSVEEATRLLTTYDVRWGCDVMRPAYGASSGVDGRVSIEVDPRLAHDTARTIAEAKALWWLVDRPNLYVKIPATEEGLPAITESLGAGISINVTLIFGLDRYDQVMDAFMQGMELARSRGHDIGRIHSVASFFVSRMDTEVDQRLEKLGTQAALALRGKAAIANAQLAYEHYERAFSTDRWESLRAAGAHPQRPLWASTSTKNPDYRDVMYVEELVAPGVVNTMPEATIHAFADHGEVKTGVVQSSYASARATLDALEALGIAYHDVTATLEREGVEKFAASWREMAAGVQAQLAAPSKEHRSEERTEGGARTDGSRA